MITIHVMILIITALIKLTQSSYLDDAAACIWKMNMQSHKDTTAKQRRISKREIEDSDSEEDDNDI